MPLQQFPSLWGRPHVIDHSTGLLSPKGNTRNGKVSVLIFDKVRCDLLPNAPGLYRQGMFTVNQPILPLSKGYEVTVKSHFRFFMFPDVYCKFSFTIDGTLLKQEYVYADRQSGDFKLELINRIKPENKEFNLRIDISMRRPNPSVQVLFMLDTIDCLII